MDLWAVTPRGDELKESNTGLVQRVIDEIWNRGELEAADELLAPDYVNHGGLILDLIRGPEAVKVSAALHRTAFPDLYIAVEESSTEGDVVVIDWTAHRRPPPVGVCAGTGDSLRGTTRCRLESGRIAESWTTWDSMAVLDRLGITATKGGE